MMRNRSLFMMAMVLAIVISGIIVIKELIPPQPTEPIIDSNIRVSGTKLVDKHGREVVLRGIVVSPNDMERIEGTSKRLTDFRPENLDSVYFKEEDVIDMKQHGATHIDLTQIRWTRLISDSVTIRISYFENWLDYFIAYCESNEVPYLINMMSLSHSSLQWGPYLMPDFVYESSGYEDGWWEKTDAYEIQADIIYKFFTSNDPKMEWCRQKWFETWVFIVKRYKDNKYCIGFVLTNEPTHFTWKHLTDDQSFSLAEGYSKTIEECIDAIRTTGAKQVIFVDKPYLKGFLDRIKPVNRSNIVWEAHTYHSEWCPDIEDWKTESIDKYVDKFVHEFSKPLYIGEYGQDPINFKRDMSTAGVKTSISEQVNYMKSQPICGYAYFTWGRLDGRGWSDWQYDWYTAEETDYILGVIFK